MITRFSAIFFPLVIGMSYFAMSVGFNLLTVIMTSPNQMQMIIENMLRNVFSVRGFLNGLPTIIIISTITLGVIAQSGRSLMSLLVPLIVINAVAIVISACVSMFSQLLVNYYILSQSMDLKAINMAIFGFSWALNLFRWWLVYKFSMRLTKMSITRQNGQTQEFAAYLHRLMFLFVFISGALIAINFSISIIQLNSRATELMIVESGLYENALYGMMFTALVAFYATYSLFSDVHKESVLSHAARSAIKFLISLIGFSFLCAYILYVTFDSAHFDENKINTYLALYAIINIVFIVCASRFFVERDLVTRPAREGISLVS